MSVLLRRYYQLLSSWNWLKGATIQAIVGAFGLTDGAAVIKATNAYLNVLAATNSTKAQALAGFINEDPMMVCSLGLQPQGVTMPDRWLIVNDHAYVDTLIQSNTITKIRLILRWRVVNTDQINGSRGNPQIGVFEGKWHALQTSSVAPVINTKYDTELLSNGDNTWTLKIDGEAIFVANINPNGLTFLLGALRDAVNDVHRLWCYEDVVGLYINDNAFLPFKTGKKWAAEDVSTGVAQAAGTCGMIDLVSGKFFPNANSSGSFTIPDIIYPANQTP